MADARAYDLIQPLTQHPWVRGIYLVGSASRPYRDAISDYDFEVAVADDALPDIPMEERHTFVIDPGPPRRVDHEFMLRAWSELESLVNSTRDLDHYPFQYAEALHDPAGDLAPLLERIAHLPDEVRATRCRVHYLEVVFAARRSAKCFERGDPLDTHLVATAGINALVNLLFVLEGRWPSTRHWATEELRLVGVPERTLAALAEAVVEPTIDRMNGLIAIANEGLETAGLDLHADYQALIHWAFLTPEGGDAFRTWGAR